MNLPAWPKSTVGCLIAIVALPGLATTSIATEQDWTVEGRPLPEHRLQRPGLDSKLPAYHPCPVPRETALVGTAPAILPDLVGRWIGVFENLVPRVSVDVPPPYGGPQGALSPRLQQFLQGSDDFAFLTRAMSLADRATFQSARGHTPVAVPVAGGSFAHLGFVDPVVIVVNEANPVERLGKDEMRRLFALSVTGSRQGLTWGDLGVAEWSERRVAIVGGAGWGGEPSARGLVVRERLLAGDSLRTDLGAGSGPESEVPARVASNPGAIGFTGLGHLIPGIRPLPIADGDGKFVAPTFDTVARASYPLARTVDLVLATPAGQSPEPAMAEFLRFLLSRDGQAIVLDQGVFLPLRAFQSAAALKILGLTADGCSAPTQGQERALE